MTELFDDNGAEFSKCGKYRFALWRIWNIQKPLVLFIGLNPSTANGTNDDPTIRRIKRFAKDWGYGGVYMLNCFPYISTDPKLLKYMDGIAENDHWLIKISQKCSKIIFAWGSFPEVKEYGIDVKMKKMFPRSKALIINKDGSPRHPLYVKSNVVPVYI